MKSLLLRIVILSALVVSFSLVVGYVAQPMATRSGADWSVQQLPNGQWWHARYVSGVWAEEYYYSEDHSRVMEHRYWDSLGRMIEVEYDEDGKVRKRSVRE
ncbi:hypothetical protein UFOVP1229_92 [uncultured Caudovirales phage]|uniref:Uncharacterized protein n=1 Tax=uncultured Caudovirales phage TaxID=2100421 RepID=A0A6J5R4L1_9CAUD|nr:hypothetical protein UFOVP1229_92 [uncultured Caudovirales phage]